MKINEEGGRKQSEEYVQSESEKKNRDFMKFNALGIQLFLVHIILKLFEYFFNTYWIHDSSAYLS